MSAGKVTAILVAGVFALGALACAIGFIGAWNLGNRLEQGVHASWENNKQILGQYGQKIQEMAQVPEIQRDDLIAVFTKANESRYGKTGSAAVVQWIQEQNPNLDPSTYKGIQQAIEAGRNEFQAAQQTITDKKRAYRTELGSLWGGFWLKMAGYPTIKIGYPIGTEDAYPVISTSRADDAFKKGREDAPLKLRPQEPK